MNITNLTKLSYQNTVSTQTTQELIQEYCSAINTKVVWVIGIAMVMWLLQPAIFKAFDKIKHSNMFMEEMFSSNNLKVIYKWIGLGLLFMAGYVILTMA